MYNTVRLLTQVWSSTQLSSVPVIVQKAGVMDSEIAVLLEGTLTAHFFLDLEVSKVAFPLTKLRHIERPVVIDTLYRLLYLLIFFFLRQGLTM